MKRLMLHWIKRVIASGAQLWMLEWSGGGRDEEEIRKISIFGHINTAFLILAARDRLIPPPNLITFLSSGLQHQYCVALGH